MQENPLTKFNILHDKISKESRNRRIIPQHNKGNIWQTNSQIVLNDEKRSHFKSLKSRTRQRYLFSLYFFSFNIVFEIFTKRKKEKRETEKEEVKLSLFADI
jgi:hypothetical protein